VAIIALGKLKVRLYTLGCLIVEIVAARAGESVNLREPVDRLANFTCVNLIPGRSGKLKRHLNYLDVAVRGNSKNLPNVRYLEIQVAFRSVGVKLAGFLDDRCYFCLVTRLILTTSSRLLSGLAQKGGEVKLD
jgi:hypothetical protein